MTLAVAVAAPDNRRGALLLIAAAAVFTADAAVVRLLGEHASMGQILFVRAFVQLAVVAVWITARDPALARTARPALHLVRGLTSLLCWWLYYRSFQVLDMALATTLTFTASLFVVAFAPLVLKEKVGRRRWIATALGFGGVALASGVGAASFDPGAILGLGAAAAAAVLVFLNRMLSRTEATLTIMLWIGAVASLGALPVALWDWRALETSDVALLALAGCLGTVGMFLTIEAYRCAEVSAMAPFPYLRIVFALIIGLVVFDELPSAAKLAGAAIIVACAFAETRAGPRRGLRAPNG